MQLKVHDRLAIKAARLMHLSIFRIALTPQIALVCAGASIDQATLQVNDSIVQLFFSNLPPINLSPETIEARATEIMRLELYCLPTITSLVSDGSIPDLEKIKRKKTPKIPEALRLAGYMDKDDKDENKKDLKAIGMRLKRILDRKADERMGEVSSEDTYPSSLNYLPPISVINPIPGGSYQSMSPVSMGSSLQSGTTMISSKRCDQVSSIKSAMPFDSGKSSSSNTSKFTCTEVSSSMNKSSSSGSKNDFNCPVKRKSSVEAQLERRVQIFQKDLHEIEFVIGTILLKYLQEDRLPGTHLNNADKIAAKLNEMVGFEGITGNEIKRGVKNNLIGKPPPSTGKRPSISAEDSRDIAKLLFTAESIDQFNNAVPMERKVLPSIIGDMVNSKLESDGKPTLNEQAYYEKVIQVENARYQDVGDVNFVESYRHLWMTIENFKDNYERMEEACIDLGFGRAPTTKEEKETWGHVVFYPNQLARIINIDETSVSLDGSKNGKGGRPALIHKNPKFSDLGDPINHSASKCTWLFGANMADEAIPGFLILTSSASEMKRTGALLMGCHQVEGQFGYPEGQKRHFSVGHAHAENGSMSNIIFLQLIDHIRQLYPDVADEPLKRVMIKTDGGPGRKLPSNNAYGKALGIYFVPSVPNGTSKGQEMDQLYGPLKSGYAKNLNALFDARYKANPQTARLNYDDLGYCLFGGKVNIPGGEETIELSNVFESAFSAERIKSARQKCGYFPMTQALLNDPDIRREVHESTDDDLLFNASDDTQTILAKQIVCQNNKLVQKLIKLGYKHADTLYRELKVVPDHIHEFRESVKTIPNTRERQESLRTANTAGKWHMRTNGGAPMNNNDAIISYHLNEREKVKAMLMKKEKRFTETVEAIAKKKEFFRKSKATMDYTAAQLKCLIKVKDASITVSKSKDALVKLYKTLAEKPDLKPTDFSTKDAKLLRALLKEDEKQSQEIIHPEGLPIMLRAHNLKEEVTATQIKSLPSWRQFNLVKRAFQNQSKEVCKEWIDILQQYVKGEEEFSFPSAGQSDEDILQSFRDAHSEDDIDTILQSFEDAHNVAAEEAEEKAAQKARTQQKPRSKKDKVNTMATQKVIQQVNRKVNRKKMSLTTKKLEDSVHNSSIDLSENESSFTIETDTDSARVEDSFSIGTDTESVIDGSIPEDRDDCATIDSYNGGIEEEDTADDINIIDDINYIDVTGDTDYTINIAADDLGCDANINIVRGKDRCTNTKGNSNDHGDCNDNLRMPKLSESESELLDDTWARQNERLDQDEDLAAKSAMFGKVSRRSIMTTRLGKKISDEIISYSWNAFRYRERELQKRDPAGHKKSIFYSTYFFSDLLQEVPDGTQKYRKTRATKAQAQVISMRQAKAGEYSYERVKGWGMKCCDGGNIFDADKIIIPIHVDEVHWACAVIFIKKKSIQYFDSLGMDGDQYTEVLLKYLKDEWERTKEGEFCNNQWSILEKRKNLPQQSRGGNDCGVFICLYADYISLDRPCCFDQSVIDECRKRLALSILNGDARSLVQVGDEIGKMIASTTQNESFCADGLKSHQDNGFEYSSKKAQAPDWEIMAVDKLKDACKERGIKTFWNSRKDTLIRKLQEHKGY